MLLNMILSFQRLLVCQKSVPLQRVFHSIRFKVNKGWSTAVLLFLCPYVSYLYFLTRLKIKWIYFSIELTTLNLLLRPIKLFPDKKLGWILSEEFSLFLFLSFCEKTFKKLSVKVHILSDSRCIVRSLICLINQKSSKSAVSMVENAI